MSLSVLCLECGLCCDGTLFRHVEISLAERDELIALGIGVGEKSKRQMMWLPCGKLEGRCCTIYEARPGGCQRFVCAAGKRLVGNELSLDEARVQVQQMLSALAALREAFAAPEGVPALRHARACIDSTTSRVTDAQLEAFQRVEDLRYRLFMPPPV